MLAQLTAGALAPIVRELLEDPFAWPEAWEAQRVAWTAVNPGTLGIFRLRGVADTRGRRTPFTLVFKAVADATDQGLPDNGYMHEPRDWNYWKREPLAFASGLLSRHSGPLLPVRCVGVEDHGDTAFMWLEELREQVPAGSWPLSRHLRAAEHLGRFSGSHVHNLPSVAEHPWLCQDFTRGWLASMGEFGATAACESDEVWRHPALRGAFPRPLARQVSDLLADADRLLAVRGSLPLTMTHHDAHRDNLFSDDVGSTARTRALDWGFLGLAPVGEDLGHQIGVNVFQQHVAAADASQYEESATEAFLSGLRATHVDVDDARVSTYARAVAALRLVSFGSAHVAWLSEEPAGEDDGAAETPWPTSWATARAIGVDELMARWAAAFTWLLDLGNRARRSAEAL